jgi:hypothetical protein
MTTRTLAGKTILVSGGSRGIGLLDPDFFLPDCLPNCLPDAPLPARG